MRFRGTLLLLITLFAASAQNRDAVRAKAIKEIQAGEFEAVLSTVRPFLERSPNDAELWNLLGIAESELNHTAAARKAFESGLKVEPDSTSLNENTGFLYFRIADYRTAERYLSKAIALGSDKPGVAFSYAASLARTGREEQALSLLEQLEGRLSGQADYWTERGWLEVRKKPPDNAERSFDHALALAPDDVRALNGAALAAESAKQDEKALSYLLRARKAQPDDIRTLLHFGSLCLRRDLSVDARDALERARKLAPSNNLALFLYARVQIAFQQWQASHALFTEFIARVPNYAPAHYALGWLDLKLNRPAEARQHLDHSLALDPAQADVRYELGALDLQEGNLDAAGKELQAVLAKEPSHSKANVAMGDLMLRRGNLEEAKSRYEAAIAADPRSGPAHYKLSTVLMRLHENERATSERSLGAQLNAEAEKAGRVVLVLSNPEGELLMNAAGRKEVE